MNKKDNKNPFSDKKEQFPVSYNYAEIESITYKKNESDDQFYIKSNVHQTPKFVPLGFYKLICLGVKMQNNSEL
ncbi:hypothetical protein [Aquimarina celericrescens]|uniref:Uncharacterized protein n=1 Tax=Aquimarina celericrescens TaxID=1964542 RepID=A0ABW5ASW9_9FLAO|nr:hypothetical protein [Aquimarina celericrescens]